uniref:Uncharacterized protein n=1 Tax=Panagrolaimus sp. ES5 TaxID=591445 RepID=A0AC34GTY7_9BILA
MIYFLFVLAFLLFNCKAQILSNIVTNDSPISMMIDSSTNEEMIRQCTCEEGSECTDEMKNQAMECLEPCWQKFDKLTKEPLKLKDCFEGQRNFMGKFLDCFGQSINGCASNDTTNLIPKKSISNYFQTAVTKIKNAPNAFGSPLTASLRQLLDTSAIFAQCVHKCFIAKNSNGFCFDRKGCQPLISDFTARKSMQTCVKKLHWKQVAGETCDCAVDSGVDPQVPSRLKYPVLLCR